MFKRKMKFDIAKIEQKLNAGNKPEKMFVYTFDHAQEKRVFVASEYKVLQNKCDQQQVDYFCKMLEGCGFSL